MNNGPTDLNVFETFQEGRCEKCFIIHCFTTKTYCVTSQRSRLLALMETFRTAVMVHTEARNQSPPPQQQQQNRQSCPKWRPRTISRNDTGNQTWVAFMRGNIYSNNYWYTEKIALVEMICKVITSLTAIITTTKEKSWTYVLRRTR